MSRQRENNYSKTSANRSTICHTNSIKKLPSCLEEVDVCGNFPEPPKVHEAYDNGDGFNACIHCGLVISDNYQDLPEVSDNTIEELDILVDICENNCIPNEIKNKAIEIRRDLKVANAKRANREQLSLYSLYIAFIECNAPRIPSEVERMFGCRYGEICEIQKKVHLNIKTVPGTAYTERFCAELGVHFSHVEKIKRLINATLELRMVTPQCQNAVLMFVYFHYHLRRLDITLDKIAQVCSISPLTILKLCKKIDTLRLYDYDLMCMPRYYVENP
jgi:transcription initiation factor TFIIIB Brf1 subunit/transcription initiation factor TFIIB